MSAQCRGCGKFFQPVCVDHEGGPRVLWTCPDNVLGSQGHGPELVEVSPGRYVDVSPEVEMLHGAGIALTEERDVMRNVVIEEVQLDGSKIVSFYEKLKRVIE